MSASVARDKFFHVVHRTIGCKHNCSQIERIIFFNRLLSRSSAAASAGTKIHQVILPSHAGVDRILHHSDDLKISSRIWPRRSKMTSDRVLTRLEQLL